MTEWDIQLRASACNGCNAPFADKQPYHTLLNHTVEGYRRRDLCADCFSGTSRDAVISQWHGKYRLPPPPPPEPIQKDTAETLLRKLVESNDPTQAGPRYILAVMLERKKILKHRDTVSDEAGNELLVYEHASSGESFTIPDPHLHLNQLEDVQQQVAELLNPPSNEAAPTGDAASATSVS